MQEESTPESAGTAPPAGWYPDPKGQGNNRWWDGGAWTDHMQPLTPTGVPVAQPYSAAANHEVKNGVATASIILSVVSLLINPALILSVLGIIFGGVGISRAERIGVGSSVAKAGLIIGIISTIVGFFLISYNLRNLGF